MFLLLPYGILLHVILTMVSHISEPFPVNSLAKGQEHVYPSFEACNNPVSFFYVHYPSQRFVLLLPFGILLVTCYFVHGIHDILVIPSQ